MIILFLITQVDTLNIVSPGLILVTLPPVDSCLYYIVYVGEGEGNNCHCNCVAPSFPFYSGNNLTNERDSGTYETNFGGVKI